MAAACFIRHFCRLRQHVHTIATQVPYLVLAKQIHRYDRLRAIARLFERRCVLMMMMFRPVAPMRLVRRCIRSRHKASRRRSPRPGLRSDNSREDNRNDFETHADR